MPQKKEQTNHYDKIRRDAAAGRTSFAYVFGGEENYLKEAALRELRALISPGTEDFNLFSFDAAALEPEILVDAVETIPSFSEKKLVVLRDFNLSSPPAKFVPALERIFDSPPEYTMLVFLYIQSEFSPPRGKKPEYWGEIEIMNFTRPDRSALLNWVIRRLKAGGRDCSRNDAEYLVFVNGGTMESLIPELGKLCAYRPGTAVTREDINLVITRSIDAEIYKITDMICRKNPREALRITSLLMEERSRPTDMLAAISRAARQMYGAKLVSEAGRGARELMDLFGLRFPFIAENLLKSAASFSRAGLYRWLGLCLEAEEAIKTFSQDDESAIIKLITEMALVK